MSESQHLHMCVKPFKGWFLGRLLLLADRIAMRRPKRVVVLSG